MSGLLFLTSDDFFLKDGSKGKIICNNIPNFSLILFYSTNCPHCQEFIPIFKSLPGTLTGCQFGMINVNKNKNIIRLSKQTISPITFVPYIILFINGKPFMRYDGPPNQQDITNFVHEISQKVENKQQFSRAAGQQQQQQQQPIIMNKKIPEYSIAQPLYGCEDGICYLEFNNAYNN
tara:strand:+ start:484 stop:1014 length:531 start_codon:yes stop_codon:yes gene_type:complete